MGNFVFHKSTLKFIITLRSTIISKKPHIFFISGLGADHRAFDRIDLAGYEQTHIPWVIPEKNDSMHSYAQKMAEPILAASHPVVIGVSLGGMIASEMTTFVPHLHAIWTCNKKVDSELSLMRLYFGFVKRFDIQWVSCSSKLSVCDGYYTKLQCIQKQTVRPA